MSMLTKTAIAAALIATMAGAAHAQSTPARSGETRQIQVLPAPGTPQVAEAQQAANAPAAETDGAAAQPQQATPAPSNEAAPAQPAPAPQAAPNGAPVPPKVVAPKRPAFAHDLAHERYGYYGYHREAYASYGYAPKRYRNNCH